jgi:DNA polymerase III sliding clamp (beta) subunit (PCNA family)
MRIGFNAKYLLDAIKSINEEKVRISFMGKLTHVFLLLKTVTNSFILFFLYV